MKCDKCEEEINRGMAGSKHKVHIINVTADNIDEFVGDINFPKDEMGLREFLEDNQVYMSQIYKELSCSKD